MNRFPKDKSQKREITVKIREKIEEYIYRILKVIHIFTLNLWLDQKKRARKGKEMEEEIIGRILKNQAFII